MTLDAAMDSFDVDFTWSGLTAPVTAAHIHMAPVGVPGPVIFPFMGITNTTSGHFTGTFMINATQLGWLQSGLLYMNIHDMNSRATARRATVTPSQPTRRFCVRSPPHRAYAFFAAFVSKN